MLLQDSPDCSSVNGVNTVANIAPAVNPPSRKNAIMLPRQQTEKSHVIACHRVTCALIRKVYNG